MLLASFAPGAARRHFSHACTSHTGNFSKCGNQKNCKIKIKFVYHNTTLKFWVASLVNFLQLWCSLLLEVLLKWCTLKSVSSKEGLKIYKLCHFVMFKLFLCARYTHMRFSKRKTKGSKNLKDLFKKNEKLVSHLSKGKAELKQNKTQDMKLFSDMGFCGFALGVVRFIQSIVRLSNYFNSQ